MVRLNEVIYWFDKMRQLVKPYECYLGTLPLLNIRIPPQEIKVYVSLALDMGGKVHFLVDKPGDRIPYSGALWKKTVYGAQAQHPGLCQSVHA